MKLGWLLGILDGEGCFGLGVRTWNEFQIAIRPRVSFQMIPDEKWINYAESVLDELGYKYRSAPIGGKYHIISLSGKHAIKFCIEFGDRLKIKYNQAKIIASLPLDNARKVTTSHGQRYACKEMFEFYANALDKIHGLNGNKGKKIKWTGDRFMQFFWDMPNTIRVERWRSKKDINTHKRVTKYLIVGKKPEVRT